MTLRARVRIVDSGDAEYLIRAFFEEFNPKSSILIKDEDAKVKIVFDEPPQKIIEAMTNCEVMYFHYGDTLEDWNEDGTEQTNDNQTEQVVFNQLEEEVAEDVIAEQSEEEVAEDVIAEQSEEEVAEDVIAEQPEEEVAEDIIAEQSEEEVAEDVIAEQSEEEVAENVIAKQPNEEAEEVPSEQPKKKRGRPTTKKEKPIKAISAKTINLPELEEIAQKSTSYEHFVKLVAEWLEMDKRHEFFENLAIAATEVDSLSWNNIDKVFERKGITYTAWDKIWTSQQVSTKLNGSVKIMSLLDAMSQYKEYSFETKEEEEVSNLQKSGDVSEEVPVRSPEDVAEEVPFTQSEEQVAEVLESMQEEIPGLSKIVEQSASYEDFLGFVTTWIGFTGEKHELFVNILKVATNLENITWKNIMESLNKQNIKCGSSEYNSCCQKLYKKFEDVTVVRFIKVIVTYKEFEFKGEGRYSKPVEEATDIEPQEDVKPKEQLSNESGAIRSKYGVKMVCMPEIPYFEKKLAQIDRTQPIEERVKYVLEAMGLKSQKPQEQQGILEIVNEAMGLEGKALATFLFNKDMILKQRMTFANFVNNFVRLHTHDPNMLLKLVDFLRDLKAVVTFEE